LLRRWFRGEATELEARRQHKNAREEVERCQQSTKAEIAGAISIPNSGSNTLEGRGLSPPVFTGATGTIEA
jgi:hypothetical protein